MFLTLSETFFPFGRNKLHPRDSFFIKKKKLNLSNSRNNHSYRVVVV